MHAVLTKVTIKEQETAESYLREQVVPGAKQAPGFVAGYWIRDGDVGRGIIVFDSDDAAKAASERLGERIGENPGVTLDGVIVGEVIASA
jgi:hypothetical protein